MIGHVTSVRTYVGVFVALIVLTAVTVAVAELDLGAMNIVAALAIACTKATLVVWFFMGFRFSPLIARVSFVAAVAMLLVLLGGALDDYLTRRSPTYLPYESLDGVVAGMGLEGVPPRAAR
jgi:cytochrome c oxidase subunit 4